ncbi:MAG: hypothetical protein MN733_30925, partial [Nitrososphaera sp.]|nr:hypothetical protein [Nitrososphaera sp.]
GSSLLRQFTSSAVHFFGSSLLRQFTSSAVHFFGVGHSAEEINQLRSGRSPAMLQRRIAVKKISKYMLSAFATAALSIAIANVSALATCTTDVQDEYTCYPTDEDAEYCYYDCYCKVSESECEGALDEAGYVDA